MISENKKLFLASVLPSLFYMLVSHFLTKFYYEFSMLRFENCIEYSKGTGSAGLYCSIIAESANSAFSSALSLHTPFIILLSTLVFIFFVRLQSVNKELKEIKEKLNA